MSPPLESLKTHDSKRHSSYEPQNSYGEPDRYGYSYMAAANSSGLQQDVIDDFLKMEDHGEVNLDADSVYGLAIAMPQIARSLPNRLFVALAARSYFLLVLNCVLQLMLLIFIGQAVQIMDILSGRMHLCDFGAALQNCPGGPGCMGPGGTEFTKTRLYDYTQWSIHNFVKRALLHVLPEHREIIEEHVDPGEFGMENYWCRFVSCFLLAVSMLEELYSCFDMLTILWCVPTKPESWIEFREGDRERESEENNSEEAEQKVFKSLDYVRFKVKGMPKYWKIINCVLVLFPKCFLWWFVVWQGFILLMETASNVDLVLGSLAVSFICSVDEMILGSLSSKSARYIMSNLEQYVVKSVANEHFGCRKWFSLMLPKRFFLALTITLIFIGKYYWRKCRWDHEYGMFVSRDMQYPDSVIYAPWDLLGRSFIKHEQTPFWSMPEPEELR